MPTLLDQVRYREFLFPAWDTVRTAGIRSPSNATRVAVRRFRETAPRNLERVQKDLRRGTFRFNPATGVPIRREGKDPRPIVIQDVRDRVVQRSLLNVIMSVESVHGAVDTGFSFGGVPGRGVRDALAPVVKHIRSGSARYYIRSDIKNFFGSMPREVALAGLAALLPDRSLDEFLDVATKTELSNYAELGHLLDFFPDEFTGVPQGHALSALLANLLLRPLDREINRAEVRGVRYLDDFIILGPDKSTAWDAFKRARAELAGLGLTCYAPGKSSKAKQGGTDRMLEFLGCEVSKSFVRPSKKNRQKLLTAVREALHGSVMAMKGGRFTNTESYRRSVATTLMSVSRKLQGWSEQFSFCNWGPLQRKMDDEVDELLRWYLGSYGDFREKSPQEVRRRMAGIWLLRDAAHEPLV